MSEPPSIPNPSSGRPRARPKGQRTRKPRRKLHTRLHRWIGLWSFAVVLVIAITGVALNHTEALKLDDTHVTASPVLKRYGMEPDGEPAVFAADKHLLALWEGECLFDGVAVQSAPEGGELVAAGRVNAAEFAFVFATEVIVCDADGGLVDRLDAASLPAGNMVAAGSDDDELVLKLDSGEQFRLENWLETVPATAIETGWFAPIARPTPQQKEILAGALRGEGLPLSRVVLDLHSGRFFGWLGVLIYDLAALSLVALGITGIMLWLRRR